jgi:hypothetical protein
MRPARRHKLGLVCSAAVGAILANSLAQGQPASGTSDPLTLLKIDGGEPGAATEGISNCSPGSLKIKFQGNLTSSINAKIGAINAQMQRQDFSGALGTARLAAEGFSYCYTKFGTDADAATYAAAVGHFLTEEVIAAHSGNEVNAEIEAAEGRARALLSYGKGAAQDTSADLAALDALAPKKQTPVGGAAATQSAQAVVAAFEGNQLRFDTQYDNHTMQVSGSARKVLEAAGGTVWIIIVGHSPDDRPADDVICDIPDSTQKQKASELSVPGPVTVEGTYHASHGALGAPQVRLSDCSVVSNGLTAK